MPFFNRALITAGPWDPLEPTVSSQQTGELVYLFYNGGQRGR